MHFIIKELRKGFLDAGFKIVTAIGLGDFFNPLFRLVKERIGVSYEDEPLRDDLRFCREAILVAIDREVNNHKPFARERFSFAHYTGTDIADTASVDKDIAAGYPLTDFHFAIMKFDRSSVLDGGDPVRRNSDFSTNCCMLFQVTQFAMNRDEMLRLYQLNEELHFLLAGVTGNVHRCDGVIDYIGAAMK